MASHEEMLAYQYMVTTLSGDSTLMSYVPGGVYRNEAPPTSTTPPYIILSAQSGRDVTTANAYRIYSSILMNVWVVGPASLAATMIVPAVKRLDALIGLVRTPQLTADGNGLILTCYRESPLSRDELINGEQWLNSGGAHRMYVQAIG